MFDHLAVDAVFDLHGKAATYTAPGGGAAIGCKVMWSSADRVLAGLGTGNGRPVIQGNVIEVRKSEVAAPARGGVIAIEGGGSHRVLDDPHTADDDSERLVWLMTVT
jgi:hypothetical protein